MVGHGKAPNQGNDILIVEDHEETARMLVELLREEGYSALWVNNAGAALDLLRSCDASPSGAPSPRPRLVLLDLTMSGMSPLEMASKMKEIISPAPPVVVLSARPIYELEAAARLINAAGVVRKPFQIEVLLGTIQQVLS